MRVLVACEFSGIVRDAFRARGHDAWSCDLLDTEREGPHLKGPVEDWLDIGWDLMIAHPPCTHLAVSGARWFKGKEREQAEALEFVAMLLGAGIPRIALENPVSVISTAIRKPDQIIQPYQFGHPEVKATCLWLKNLPKLKPTDDVSAEMMNLSHAQRNRVWFEKKGNDEDPRWKRRSRTLQGIADAMADQWGAESPIQLEAAL